LYSGGGVTEFNKSGKHLQKKNPAAPDCHYNFLLIKREIYFSGATKILSDLFYSIPYLHSKKNAPQKEHFKLYQLRSICKDSSSLIDNELLTPD